MAQNFRNNQGTLIGNLLAGGEQLTAAKNAQKTSTIKTKNTLDKDQLAQIDPAFNESRNQKFGLLGMDKFSYIAYMKRQ